MVNVFVFFKLLIEIVCFVVAIFELVHDVVAKHCLPYINC